MKVSKNIVSYFEAGYRAGLIDSGKTKSAVDRMFYVGIVYPNRVRDLLREYDSEVYDDDGIIAMEKKAMKTRNKLV